MAVNYDESQVPQYTLPDPLRTDGGEPVQGPATWRSVRRPEILGHFAREMYGRTPLGKPEDMQPVLVEQENGALEGRAVRSQVRLEFAPEGPAMELLVYLPADVSGPVPLFMGLNFHGNHTVHADPSIRLPSTWVRKTEITPDHQATEAGRGSSAGRWPVEMILNRGYGLATAYYGDLDPDFDDGFANGVHPLAYRRTNNTNTNRSTQ